MWQEGRGGRRKLRTGWNEKAFIDRSFLLFVLQFANNWPSAVKDKSTSAWTTFRKFTGRGIILKSAAVRHRKRAKRLGTMEMKWMVVNTYSDHKLTRLAYIVVCSLSLAQGPEDNSREEVALPAEKLLKNVFA
ncbi:hypothetical protein J6590_049580 [Homalodisca vitripennis]|nr:hypothetical protein J6590_049580 [Homalodisca vitripennis]